MRRLLDVGQDRRGRHFLGGLDGIGLERWLAGAGRVSGRGAASRVSGIGTARCAHRLWRNRGSLRGRGSCRARTRRHVRRAFDRLALLHLALDFHLGAHARLKPRLVHEMRLRVESNRLALGAHLREEPKRRVAAVGKQLAQLRRVGKRDVDVGQNAVAQLLVEHGPGDFHALIHVARHKVGARQVDLHVRARAEPIDAAMLEHASHDRDDAHILGVAFHAWDQA